MNDPFSLDQLSRALFWAAWTDVCSGSLHVAAFAFCVRLHLSSFANMRIKLK